jgi:hypothetical protein
VWLRAARRTLASAPAKAVNAYAAQCLTVLNAAFQKALQRGLFVFSVSVFPF